MPYGRYYDGSERYDSGRTQTAGYSGPIARPFRLVSPSEYYGLKTLYEEMAEEHREKRREKKRLIAELGLVDSVEDPCQDDFDQNCKILKKVARDNGLVRVYYRRKERL